jgi:hypothetical protein
MLYKYTYALASTERAEYSSRVRLCRLIWTIADNTIDSIGEKNSRIVFSLFAFVASMVSRLPQVFHFRDYTGFRYRRW